MVFQTLSVPRNACPRNRLPEAYRTRTVRKKHCRDDSGTMRATAVSAVNLLPSLAAGSAAAAGARICSPGRLCSRNRLPEAYRTRTVRKKHCRDDSGTMRDRRMQTDGAKTLPRPGRPPDRQVRHGNNSGNRTTWRPAAACRESGRVGLRSGPVNWLRRKAGPGRG